MTLPVGVCRVDVAGGTLAGWSALLTTIAVPRLAAGGQVTVLDLTEGGVAADLIAVAGHLDIDPAVWVLPADLASLQLGADFSREVFADVLALTVHAADGNSDRATDSALIARVLEVLGDGASMARILAALRALGQIGNADQHLGQVLSQTELTRLSTLAGRGAERLVVDRAWAIEARLRILGPLATTRPMPSQLKVAWLDRRATAVGNATLAAYLTVAITAVLRQAPPSRPWQQTAVAARCRATARRRSGPAVRRDGERWCRASARLPVDPAAGTGTAWPWRLRRCLHAAGQCRGGQVRLRANRHRAPPGTEPADGHGRDVDHRNRRRLLHQHHGRDELGLADADGRAQPSGPVRAVRI